MPNGTCRVVLPQKTTVKVVSLPAGPGVVGGARMEAAVELAGGGPVRVYVTELLRLAAGVLAPDIERALLEEAEAESEAFKLASSGQNGSERYGPAAASFDFDGTIAGGWRSRTRVVALRDGTRTYRVTAAWPEKTGNAARAQARTILDSLELVPPAAK